MNTLHKYPAIFYDGLSSMPHEVTISYEDVASGIKIPLKHSIIFWNYNDLIIDGDLNAFTVKNKSFPSESLYITEPDAYYRLQQMCKMVGNYGIYSKLIHSNRALKWVLFLSLIVLAGVAYFKWVPGLAAKAVVLLPASVDQSVGDAFYNSSLKHTLKIDSNASKTIQQLVMELPYRGKIPVQVWVDKSSVMNAYALPNGIIIINSALINKTKSHAELLAVVGHEMTHVSERHSMSMLTKNLTNLLLISIVFSDVNGMAQILIDNAQQLNSLSYSRAYEVSADKGSFELLKTARLSPIGLRDFFKTMDKENISSSDIPDFLLTHPASKNRVKAAEKLIKDHSYEVRNDTANMVIIYKKLKAELTSDAL